MVGVAVVGQPFNAAATAVTISSTVMAPSPLASPGVHDDSEAAPRATFTISTSSSTVTAPLLLQSPTQPACAVCGMVTSSMAVAVKSVVVVRQNPICGSSGLSLLVAVEAQVLVEVVD